MLEIPTFPFPFEIVIEEVPSFALISVALIVGVVREVVTVTSLGRPIVSVVPAPDVTISFIVPATVSDSESKSTDPVPLSPPKSRFDAVT